MKTFTLASIVALASISAAQLDNIPSCALPCLVGPLTSDGCTALTDFKCHCEKGDALLAQVQPCVEKACSADDQKTTIEAVESTCKAAGVPIVIPAPGGASSSAAPSSSAAESSAAPSSSAAAESSAAASSQATTSHSASASASASESAAPVSTFTGAAAQATNAAGLLGAAALAMLAL